MLTGAFCIHISRQNLFFCFPLINEFVDCLFHRHDTAGLPGIASGKGISVFKVSFESIIQRRNDAVRTLRNITRLDAVERTRFRLLDAGLHLLEEVAMDGTPRHSDRTLDNLDVLFFRLDIAFFESIAGVALGSSDETGS